MKIFLFFSVHDSFSIYPLFCIYLQTSLKKAYEIFMDEVIKTRNLLINTYPLLGVALDLVKDIKSFLKKHFTSSNFAKP